MALLSAKKLKVSKQIAAEKDQYLIECFSDNGVIDDLIDNHFEIIAGRKGTGKTAIAKYLQNKHEDFGVDFAVRLTLSDFYGVDWDYNSLTADSLVKLLMVRTAQKLVDAHMLTNEGVTYWDNYLSVHGLQNVTNFNDWFAKTKKILESKDAGISIPQIAKGELKHSDEVIYEKQLFDESASTLANRLSESILKKRKIVIVVDDVTDHLDHAKPEDVKKGLEQIKLVLHSLSGYNSKFSDDDVDLTFVCTIRDDLWDFIHGSNENKLKHSCLWLSWSEENFCKLLIRRLPHFSSRLNDALVDPINSIKEVFPDDVFEQVLELKNINKKEIKRYKTTFYAYVQLISFNRPRDFLRLCFALQKRLSQTKPIEVEHIIAAEREYEMYFDSELKDELNIFLMMFGLNMSQLLSVFKKMCEKSKISYSEFRQIIAGAIPASHNNVYKFASALWRYSLIGFIPDSSFARFRHNSPQDNTYELPSEDDMKKLYFLLHRGIYWRLLSTYDE